jgi:hypothetical protein
MSPFSTWFVTVDNIKMDPRETGCDDVRFNELSQNMMKEILNVYGAEPSGFGQENLSAA